MAYLFITSILRIREFANLWPHYYHQGWACYFFRRNTWVRVNVIILWLTDLSQKSNIITTIIYKINYTNAVVQTKATISYTKCFNMNYSNFQRNSRVLYFVCIIRFFFGSKESVFTETLFVCGRQQKGRL